MLFSDILQKYSAIDTGFGTDKITSHSYDTCYNELFLPYKYTCSNLLEIGFDGGFSLMAYEEYFTNSVIYGIDIIDNRNNIVRNNHNLKVYFGDATAEKTVNAFPYNFDIIVEDASHLPEHQIKHFIDYSKYVKPGGIYVIEDVHEKYYKDVYNKLENFATENGFTSTIYDLRYKKNRFDDILIVFTKLNTAI